VNSTVEKQVLEGKMAAWQNNLNELYYLYDDIHPTSKFGHRWAAARRRGRAQGAVLARPRWRWRWRAAGAALGVPPALAHLRQATGGAGVPPGALPPLLTTTTLPCPARPPLHPARSLGEVSYELFEKTLRDLDAHPLHQVRSCAPGGAGRRQGAACAAAGAAAGHPAPRHTTPHHTTPHHTTSNHTTTSTMPPHRATPHHTTFPPQDEVKRANSRRLHPPMIEGNHASLADKCILGTKLTETKVGGCGARWRRRGGGGEVAPGGPCRLRACHRADAACAPCRLCLRQRQQQQQQQQQQRRELPGRWPPPTPPPPQPTPPPHHHHHPQVTSDGFEWVNESKSDRPKWGYVGLRPGERARPRGGLRVSARAAAVFLAGAGVQRMPCPADAAWHPRHPTPGTPTHTNTHQHTPTHTNTHQHTPTHTHAHTHTPAHAHAHTHAHAHAHTHAHTRTIAAAAAAAGATISFRVDTTAGSISGAAVSAPAGSAPAAGALPQGEAATILSQMVLVEVSGRAAAAAAAAAGEGCWEGVGDAACARPARCSDPPPPAGPWRPLSRPLPPNPRRACTTPHTTTQQHNNTTTQQHNNTTTQHTTQHTPHPPQVAHLKSYENMGRAEVTCSNGCACERTVIDANNTLDNSQTFLHPLPVRACTARRSGSLGRRASTWGPAPAAAPRGRDTRPPADARRPLAPRRAQVSQAPECQLTFTILADTSSGKHKFKVIGLTISEPGGQSISNVGAIDYVHDIASRDAKGSRFDVANHVRR
jgi:hypothetical protein